MFDLKLKHKLLDVIKYRLIYLVISLVLMIPGIIGMLYLVFTTPNHLPLKVGIDFTGGTILQYEVDQKVDNNKLSNLRHQLISLGFNNPVLQTIQSSDSNSSSVLSIKTQFLDGKEGQKKTQMITSKVQEDLTKNAKLIQVSSIGPTLGKELFKNSLIAMALALSGIVIYLSFRFKSDYATIALVSLCHDVLIVLGAFALLGIFFNVHIDSLFITAVLTVIGFSVHDTIVVYDRIRENQSFFGRKLDFSQIVNASVNQTLARSINTSLTTLITLIALYLFGGETTKDFVLAMIIGISVGTYSSIFVASMLLAWYREKSTMARSSNNF